MLTTLIESGALRTRSGEAQAFSVALHAALIAAAVAATQQAATSVEPIVAEPVQFVAATTSAPQPATPPTVIARLKGFRLMPTLVRIPDMLPDMDLRVPFTDPGDYIARGVPGGDPRGVEQAGVDRTVDQVDRSARLLPGSGHPAYPESLRSAGTEGDVTVQFVIDTAGRAVMRTLTIISSTHAGFTDAVSRALAKARFAPAEFDGRRVRQVVRMPFVFSLEKR